jgi:hydroxymethylglutaryl-CoA reductase
MATTEGALVASATRGAKAISRSGGCTTKVLSQQMLRAPLFIFSDMKGALMFTNWVRDHVPEIRAEALKVSQHADLLSVEPFLIGRMVHVRFLYETGDAAGQNMTTATTWRACRWLMEQMTQFDEIMFENFIIEANMSGDKKVNYLSFISGRGTRVTAECHIEREVLRKVLKVTPEQLALCNAGFMAGSVQVGMIGYNINVANVIAAIFTATGQDIACVHE